MSRLNMRVERLEATTGKGVKSGVIVFSDEEEEAARQELGPDIIIMHIQFISAPDKEVVPYDYNGKDYAWRVKVNRNHQEAKP